MFQYLICLVITVAVSCPVIETVAVNPPTRMPTGVRGLYGLHMISIQLNTIEDSNAVVATQPPQHSLTSVLLQVMEALYAGDTVLYNFWHR